MRWYKKHDLQERATKLIQLLMLNSQELQQGSLDFFFKDLFIKWACDAEGKNRSGVIWNKEVLWMKQI